MNNNPRMASPPKLAEWLILRLFPDRQSYSLAGDLAEVYHEIARHHGRLRACFWYWRQVLLAVPAFFNQTMYWNTVMLKNYVKMAIRNLYKNRMASAINLLGLSAAIGCSIVVFLFIEDQYSQDAFHKNGEKIFLIETQVERNGKVQLWGDSPLPLGPAMQADFPQIERVVRIDYGTATMRFRDKVFNETLYFVSPEYLDMFTFPLKYGDISALQQRSNVILSEEVAAKYFGESNPVGQQVTLHVKGKQSKAFFVGGVAKKFPLRASFRFDVLLRHDLQVDLGVRTATEMNDWKKFAGATLIQLRNPKDLAEIAQNMEKYRELQTATDTNWPIKAFVLDNLRNLALNSYKVSGDISHGSEPVERITLFFVALFLLLLACFNYMNIAIASAGNRLKEIGVRKVIGSRRWQLIQQFLGENILLCLIALVFGAILAQFIFVPTWNSLFQGENLVIDYTSSIWLFFIALLLFTGLVAGIYPSLYVANFNPINIFRGKQKLGGRTTLTRSLLTMQFTLALVLVASGIVFSLNASFQENRDWGYDQSQKLVVELDGATQYRTFHDAIQSFPGIESIAGARYHVGKRRALTVVEMPHKKMQINQFEIGPGYFKTIQLRLQAGRFFDERITSDLQDAVIVNEEFVRRANLTDVIGQRVRSSDSTFQTIVGVVEDFHYRDFRESIEPVAFRLADEMQFSYLIAKTRAGSAKQSEKHLADTWKLLFPDAPYEAYYQDQIFAFAMQMNEGIRKLFIFIAAVALLISCMGLFGLISMNIQKRWKEFSIRKVLGANLRHVITLVNREILTILLIATVLAAPLGFVLLNLVLDSLYSYRIPLNSGPFIIATVIVFFTAAATIASHIFKIVRASPVDGLRSE